MPGDGVWISGTRNSFDAEGLRREEEIAATIDVLLLAWRRCPELRLGQLIANALPVGFGCDPFHISDEQLREELERYRARVDR